MLNKLLSTIAFPTYSNYNCSEMTMRRSHLERSVVTDDVSIWKKSIFVERVCGSAWVSLSCDCRNWKIQLSIQ